MQEREKDTWLGLKQRPSGRKDVIRNLIILAIGGAIAFFFGTFIFWMGILGVLAVGSALDSGNLDLIVADLVGPGVFTLVILIFFILLFVVRKRRLE